MADVVAIPIIGLKGIGTSDDGQNAFLDIILGNEKITLAIPHSLLQPLLALVCAGIEQTGKQQGRQETAAFPVSWWELGRTEKGALAVRFRLENNASLSFVLGADQIPHMRQTLEVMEGKPPSDLPPSRRPN